MSEPRVLLMRLNCRTSARGVEYLSGFLGCARVVAFKAKDPDKFGNPQWEVFAAEPQQREQQRRPQPKRKQQPREQRDPRQAAVDEWAACFDEHGPDDEAPF